MKNKIIIVLPFFIFSVILLHNSACKQSYTPKPRGYFRIDFPDKNYTSYSSPCGFTFERPIYADVNQVKESYAEPCWYTIDFTAWKAKVYLTYKPVNNNLDSHIEDIHTLAYKHSIKADDIIETPIDETDRKVYGVLYDIKGNAASSVNFYITDSTNGFLSGSLYFDVAPNKDSLLPAINFFREDIVHLINTFQWK
jgi:gliding motility-associated lipoprotein GldD